jgi:hypothetical protein
VRGRFELSDAQQLTATAEPFVGAIERPLDI